MMQITKIRKYKNNYNQTYGRITLNEKIVKRFINTPNKDVLDVIVEYDDEKDILIIKKLEEESEAEEIEENE